MAALWSIAARLDSAMQSIVDKNCYATSLHFIIKSYPSSLKKDKEMSAYAFAQTAVAVAGAIETIASLFGGGKKKVIKVSDPALLAELESMKETRLRAIQNIEIMKASHEEALSKLRASNNDISAELQSMKLKVQREEANARQSFNSIMQTAKRIVSAASNDVDVLLGAQGCGKSTIANKLYNIQESVPGEGNSHFTVKITRYQRNGHRDLVDTVGRMPGMRGIMRVLACVFCHGLNPEGLIIVHNARLAELLQRCRLIGVQTMNSICFEPRSFWRLAVDSAVDVTQFIFPDSDMKYVNQIVDSSSPIAGSNLKPALEGAFETLNYDMFKRANGDEQEELFGTIYYFAKCIVERSNHRGSDLTFIDLKD